jgi:hypothetical protein
MQQDGADPPDDGQQPPAGASLQPVEAAASPEDPGLPQVRLRREYKGLTVRDLLADDGLDRQLPGRVLTALRHLERGDLAAADDVLPGRFGALLPGPGPWARRRRRLWVLLITVAALAAAGATATILLL